MNQYGVASRSEKACAQDDFLLQINRVIYNQTSVSLEVSHQILPGPIAGAVSYGDYLRIKSVRGDRYHCLNNTQTVDC